MVRARACLNTKDDQLYQNVPTITTSQWILTAPARPTPPWVRNSSAETDEESEGVSASAVCQAKDVIDALGCVTYL
jgi:hypothetical protein